MVIFTETTQNATSTSKSQCWNQHLQILYVVDLINLLLVFISYLFQIKIMHFHSTGLSICDGHFALASKDGPPRYSPIYER